MKVFVAGATGAIGRQLVPMLIERGHEVVAPRDPAREAELADSLSLAFLVVLERLSPEQRAALSPARSTGATEPCARSPLGGGQGCGSASGSVRSRSTASRGR